MSSLSCVTLRISVESAIALHGAYIRKPWLIYQDIVALPDIKGNLRDGIIGNLFDAVGIYIVCLQFGHLQGIIQFL